MKQVEFKIEGIKCEGCVNRIKKVLAKCSGIEAFDLSLETKILKVFADLPKILILRSNFPEFSRK